jgi:hypothetical protein
MNQDQILPQDAVPYTMSSIIHLNLITLFNTQGTKCQLVFREAKEAFFMRDKVGYNRSLTIMQNIE